MWDSAKRGERKAIALGLGRTYGTVTYKVWVCKRDGSYEHYVEMFKRGVA